MNSLPSSFIENIASQNGMEFSKVLEECILSTESPVSIRFQRELEDFEIEKYFDIDTQVLWDDNAYYLKSRPSFAQDPLWHAGVYYVQEASSMILGYMLKKVLTKYDHLKVLDLYDNAIITIPNDVSKLIELECLFASKNKWRYGFAKSTDVFNAGSRRKKQRKCF